MWRNVRMSTQYRQPCPASGHSASNLHLQNNESFVFQRCAKTHLLPGDVQPLKYSPSSIIPMVTPFPVYPSSQASATFKSRPGVPSACPVLIWFRNSKAENLISLVQVVKHLCECLLATLLRHPVFQGQIKGNIFHETGLWGVFPSTSSSLLPPFFFDIHKTNVFCFTEICKHSFNLPISYDQIIIFKLLRANIARDPPQSRIKCLLLQLFIYPSLAEFSACCLRLFLFECDFLTK